MYIIDAYMLQQFYSKASKRPEEVRYLCGERKAAWSGIHDPEIEEISDLRIMQ